MKEEIIVNENNIQEFTFANVQVKELFNSDDPSVSIANIRLSGKNEKNKNIGSDMFYYVTEGEGMFVINDKKYPVSKGSLVCIPMGAVYQDSGNLTMLSISVPKFNRESAVIVKD